MIFLKSSKVLLLGFLFLAISTTARAQDSTLAIVYCQKTTMFHAKDSVHSSVCQDKFISFSDSNLHFIKNFVEEDLIYATLKRKKYGKKLAKQDLFISGDDHISYVFGHPRGFKRRIEISPYSHYQFSEISGTKVILGYSCKAAVSHYSGQTVLIWYTNDISNTISKFWYPNAPGVVLETTHTYNAQSRHYIASQILRVSTELQKPTNLNLKIVSLHKK